MQFKKYMRDNKLEYMTKVIQVNGYVKFAMKSIFISMSFKTLLFYSVDNLILLRYCDVKVTSAGITIRKRHSATSPHFRQLSLTQPD